MTFPPLTDHHREFIKAETRQQESDSDEEPGEFWAGHYVLDYGSAPTVGWKVGMGLAKLGDDRGVDLMLCRPEKASKVRVAALHALIQFHPVSGVLMLVGLDTYTLSSSSWITVAMNIRSFFATTKGTYCIRRSIASRLGSCNISWSMQIMIKRSSLKDTSKSETSTLPYSTAQLHTHTWTLCLTSTKR